MMNYKTGIAGFDEFIQDGLPPIVLLLSGTSGSGNEIFARQTAFNIVKKNKLTYFTVNTPSQLIKEDMAFYGWDITAYEETDYWKFIQLSKIDDPISAILKEIKQNRIVFLDSISEMFLDFTAGQLTKLIAAMSTNNKNQQCHFILLTEAMHDQKDEAALQHFAEGIITFNCNWSIEPIYRHILIKKMRRSFIPSRKLQYSIGKKGIIIETATRITSKPS
jgi:KaiC/GvpD/RAD55 family RecA-like ATPase